MEQSEKRGQWGSRFGFIMAAAGSAVGLGNLWKFPYLVGKNGGGVFVLIYLVIVVFLGYTMMLGELAIGRNTKLNQYNAYRSINSKTGFMGVFGILSAFLILSFYSVVGGWICKYLFEFVIRGIIPDSQNFFNLYVSGTWEPILWHAVFMALTLIIVFGGVSGGIEKASKIMMPTLLVFLIIIAVRSLTLPNAMEGVAYYLKPDFSKFSFQVVVAAMGQVFFSLSMGMGVLVTYGSYLKGEEDLSNNALTIPAIDTIVALLAGFAIIPAVFSFGMEVTQGPGLLFGTLPAVFDQMPFGQLFGIIFFLLVLFAGLTSSISLLESPVSWAIDSLKWNRKTAVIVFAGLCFIIGAAASLSMGPVLGDFKIYWFDPKGQVIFDFLDYLTANILMPLGGLLLSLFITFIWGYDRAFAEIRKGSKSNFSMGGFWKISMMVLVPIMLILVFLQQMGILSRFIG
ncbi:putative sodium-dependent transporter [Clostridiaceae bacterium JG1575]|nr:putative sodium-dependent transporter [Clostridiaceae bacterium JG1575]